jgi:tetratricopeptide (TPR) repeat protein
MSEAARQAALRTVSGARAAVGRLDASRDAEDVAAELVEVWSSIETALRGLVGGSALSGQDLVREVRRRDLLTLAQTHALLDFLTVRERLNDSAYKPTDADVAAARDAVTQLETALAAPRQEPPPPAPAATPPPPREKAAAETSAAPPGARGARARRMIAEFPVWGWILVAVLAVGFAAGTAWFVVRGGDELADGRSMLREGRREAARGEFERVARENPRDAQAHLFLARMAREEGDLARAREHATAAVRADPDNGLAHREMGTILYTLGSYDVARSFLERAIRLRPNDSTAQGMMGCTLVQLGQRDLGLRFISRAGEGPWTGCAR